MKSLRDIKKELINDWKWKTFQILNHYNPIEINSMIEDIIIKKAAWENEKCGINIYQYAQDFSKDYEKKQAKIYEGKLKKTINANLKISDVARNYKFEVKKGKIICPFHADSDPSLSLSDDKNVFNCFGCGAKGDVIEFIRRLEEVKYEQANRN